VIVQRISSGSVCVDGEVRAKTGTGLLLLVGFAPDDTFSDVAWMADRIAGLRIFADAHGRMNLSVREVDGEILVVPNFTLYGDCRKGRRPSFDGAAGPPLAESLYDDFCAALTQLVPVQRGVFAAHMHVSLTNDGPITLIVETARAS
jgi:D-tyrosyl-tRNA(Tyr) deacylase